MRSADPDSYHDVAGGDGLSDRARELIDRYRAAGPLAQAFVELLVLEQRPAGAVPMCAALREAADEGGWEPPGSDAGLLRSVAAFFGRNGQTGLAPRGGAALRRVAVERLVASGRARCWAAAAPGLLHSRALAFAHYYDAQAVLDRVRCAALFGGADPQSLRTTRDGGRGAGEWGAAMLRHAFGAALPLDWLDGLHEKVRAPMLVELLFDAIEQPDARMERVLALARAEHARHPGSLGALAALLLEVAVLEGDADLLVSAGADTRYAACAMLLRGADAPTALPAFEAALKTLRSHLGPKSLLPGLAGQLHLALLAVQAKEAAARKRIDQFLKLEPQRVDAATGCWQSFMRARLAGAAFAEPALPKRASPADWWWLALLLRAADRTPSRELRERLDAARASAQAAGWRWLVAQIDALADDGAAAVPDLAGWLAPQPAWQTALAALAEVAQARTAERKGAHSRLAVRVMLEPDGAAAFVRVFEQRPQVRGFSAGREVTPRTASAVLERLAPDADADRALLRALPERAYYSSVSARSQVWSALIAHPRVTLGDSDEPLHVERGEVALRAERGAKGAVKLALEPARAACGEGALAIVDGVLRVYAPDPTLARIGAIVGAGLTLPETALAPLIELLPGLSRHARLLGDLDRLGVREVQADATLYAALEPLETGLRARIGVRPLGPGSAPHAPGGGPETVMHGAPPVRARRDLAAERAAYAALAESCAALAAVAPGETLEVADPEAALGLLEALQAEGDSLRIEWPAGRALRVARPRGATALSLTVGAQRDWFAAEGGLSLEDGSVVALAELMTRFPSAQGRYLRLSETQVLALEGELRQRLAALAALADEDGAIRVPRAAAPLLGAALAEDDAIDLAFRAQLERMEAAQRLEPELPRTFEAELRDYQLDGFRFLMRLAAWDAGACLADDMGLGKTVQALAMLCARASEGPALVIAPTSVVANWRDEARRFAPALSQRVCRGAERGAALEGLGPGDVVLTSYGVLAADVDAFAAVEFATLVLDEAQAIKNAATQRAQAVRALRARFRVATTGTPIENHLGELWSLFRVLNPGLLGSEAGFRRRFGTGAARETLRRLIAPFLLRRTKTQVLAELPPRTEIVLSVEPEREEAQLLAALRRQALERANDGALPTEQRRFRVLAEITRLRRAACHPSLVAPELALPGAKLDRLVELVEELRENRHRALVFSQFVDFLALVRERLDAARISYQYLDGATAPRAREAAVAAFQRGDGDVFLLSLKAGGVGLNLTAADYVIHLDPWWNPAVEQQASDRAHRIGQTRPVTVYKLVLAGSIEEQILALHGAKRELADQVIGGGPIAEKLGVDELIALLDSR